MASAPRVLLVVDAANIDMTLTSFVGRPTQRERPDFGVLARWLRDRAGPDRLAEACVFVNVAPQNAGPLRGWVMWLLEQGYRVFARPKVGTSDIDEDMVAHLRARADEGRLEEVLVASNDAKAFLEPLEDLARGAVRVLALGFEEFASGLADSPLIEFIDLEDIPGLFESNLPNRVRLDRLPLEGRWFEPVGPLGGEGL
jgi:uncharacterized protein